jgi:hypothetical protein
MDNKKKEPLLLRFVNLEIGNDAAIEIFLNSIDRIDDMKIDFFGRTTHPMATIEKPSVTKIRQWHKQFLPIFRHWTETKQLTAEEIEWINNQLPNWRKKLIFYEDADIDENVAPLKYVAVLEFIGKEFLSYIIDQFVNLVTNNIEPHQCEASDCKNYFIPTPRGRGQRFCSRRCFERIRYREKRSKKNSHSTFSS